MHHSKDAAIRARAYQLWVEDGYRDGYQDQHWRQAEREIEERAAADAGAGRPGAASPTAAQASARPDRHSDGMSSHPSVLDAGRGRAGP